MAVNGGLGGGGAVGGRGSCFQPDPCGTSIKELAERSCIRFVAANNWHLQGWSNKCLESLAVLPMP